MQHAVVMHYQEVRLDPNTTCSNYKRLIISLVTDVMCLQPWEESAIII